MRALFSSDDNKKKFLEIAPHIFKNFSLFQGVDA